MLGFKKNYMKEEGTLKAENDENNIISLLNREKTFPFPRTHITTIYYFYRGMLYIWDKRLIICVYEYTLTTHCII